MKSTSLVGNKYGKLTVIERVERESKKNSYWKCLCECGNYTTVSRPNLVSLKTKSCGHCDSNEIGNRYGMLVVVAQDENKIGYGRRWICSCDCGNEISVAQGNLHNGHVTSCGCKVSQNLIGQRFTKLVVIEQIGTNKHRQKIYKCKCDCGNEILVSGVSLSCGNTKSCGCLHSEAELKIRQILKTNHIKYSTEKTFIDLISSRGGRPRFDFCIETIKGYFLLEYQGEQHFRKDSKRGYLQRVETDQLKREYCKRKGIALYEISYKENLTERLYRICRSEGLHVEEDF